MYFCFIWIISHKARKTTYGSLSKRQLNSPRRARQNDKHWENCLHFVYVPNCLSLFYAPKASYKRQKICVTDAPRRFFEAGTCVPEQHQQCWGFESVSQWLRDCSHHTQCHKTSVHERMSTDRALVYTWVDSRAYLAPHIHAVSIYCHQHIVCKKIKLNLSQLIIIYELLIIIFSISVLTA